MRRRRDIVDIFSISDIGIASLALALHRRRSRLAIVVVVYAPLSEYWRPIFSLLVQEFIGLPTTTRGFPHWKIEG